MIRTAVTILEIIAGVAAIGGEIYLIMNLSRTVNREPGATPGKARVVLDLVLLDVIAVLALLAVWQVVTNGSAARWLSIVAGIAIAGIPTARPTLTGSRQGLSSAASLLGLVIVILAIFLPSPG